MDLLFSMTSSSATGGSLWDPAPPPPTGPDHNYPTLLFSWWCTMSAVAIIFARLIGRKVRSNELFREDWIMMAALIPLLIRQGLIHVVLLYRTNNVQTVGYHFSALDIEHRTTGSRLVIAARLFFALFIWISKLTVSEFLKRITVFSWRRSYEYTLRGIRIFLFVSFGCVVIATLTECQPFNHFWQVIPDPGAKCRTGYANLISMGVCDIVTDILLVAFPIPIVLRSGQSWKRKVQLTALFSLSLIMIAVTATRVPEVIFHRGRQQYRTVWASTEILASAAVSNAVILGSFLRDKGTKRNKYRSQSVSDSIERSSVRRAPNLALQRTNSEEDMFRSLGIRIPEHLREKVEQSARAAPLAPPPARRKTPEPPVPLLLPDPEDDDRRPTESSDSDDSLRKPITTADYLPPPPSSPSPVESTKRSMSFFDVGGLLLDDHPSDDRAAFRRDSRSTTLVGSSHSHRTLAHDFAAGHPPVSPTSTSHPPPPRPSSPPMSGSRAFLHDIGGLFHVSSSPNGSTRAASPAHRPDSSRRNGSNDRLRMTSQQEQSFNQQQYHGAHPHPYYHAFSHGHDQNQHQQQQQQRQNQHSSSPFSHSSRHTANPPTGVLGPMLERHETQQSLLDAGGLLTAAVVATGVSDTAGTFSSPVRVAGRAATGRDDVGGPGGGVGGAGEELEMEDFSHRYLGHCGTSDGSERKEQLEERRGGRGEAREAREGEEEQRQENPGIANPLPPSSSRPPQMDAAGNAPTSSSSQAAWETMEIGDLGGLLR